MNNGIKILIMLWSLRQFLGIASSWNVPSVNYRYRLSSRKGFQQSSKLRKTGSLAMHVVKQRSKSSVNARIFKFSKAWKTFGIIVTLRRWLLTGEPRHLPLCKVLFQCPLWGYAVIKYINVKEIVFFLFCFWCHLGNKKFCPATAVHFTVCLLIKPREQKEQTHFLFICQPGILKNELFTTN